MNVLKTMRGMKLLKGLLWIVVISFIAAIFTLWGGGLDYEKHKGGLFGANYVVKVESATISPELYRLQYRFYERQMKDMLGDNFKSSFLQGSPQRIADDMASQLISAQMAKEYGLSVSDEELVAYIQKMHNFQDPKNDYPLFLNRLGVSAGDYQEFVRLSLLLDKLKNLVGDSAYVGDEELKRLYREQEEKVRAMIAIVPTQAFLEKVPPPTAEEIKARFEKEKADWKIPEKRAVDYLKLDNAAVKDLVNIDDAAVRAYYQNNIAQYSTPKDQRRASHILIRVDQNAKPAEIEAAKKKAQALYERAKRGEDFAKLAEQNSEDGSKANGGDLGWFGRERMVKPFADAVFDQCKAVGDIVGPVQSQFGMHVIKLTGLGGDVKPFDDVKKQIRQTLLLQDAKYKEQQAKLLADLTGEFKKAAEDDAAFKALAEKKKITVSSLKKKVGREDSISAMGSDPKIKEAVFEAPAGKWQSVDVTSDAGSQVVFFKVAEISPEHPATLEDVKDELQIKIKREKAAEMARQAALALRAGSKDATTLEAAAQKAGYNARQSESIGVKDQVPNVGRDPALVKALLAAPLGGMAGPTKTTNGYVVACVTEKTDADMAKFDSKKAELRQQQAEEYSRQVVEDWVQRRRKVLEEKKAISFNQYYIDQLEPHGEQAPS